MQGMRDDVRLPFSVLDPVLGDVFSLLWEPETIVQTGNALRILTSEVLTSAGQQILAATIMTALMAAVQLPVSAYTFVHGVCQLSPAQCSPN
jgi:hypothetical protein